LAAIALIVVLAVLLGGGIATWTRLAARNTRYIAGGVADDGNGALVPAIFDPADWDALAQRLTAAGTQFVIEPHTRFKGEAGEQSTMFFLDPSGNALEFKAFADDAMVFAR